jgi:hypothetical protein
VSASVGRGAVENLGVGVTFDDEVSGETALQSGKGMVYEDEVTGYFDIELDHGCASGWDESGLHVCERCAGE